MKISLFVRQTIKENYKYLLTILLIYGFLGVLYHITPQEEIQVYGIQLVTYIFSIIHAVVLPAVLFKNYYHQTNVNHLASIPLKRYQIYLSLYLAGMMFSITMIIGFSVLTSFITQTSGQFMAFTSALLMGFMYYYHLSLLAVVVCGEHLFQCVVLLILGFGPIVTYLIYQWSLEMYVHTYLISNQLSTILYLIPGIGCASYWIEVNPSIYYSLYIKEIIGILALCLICVQHRPNEKVGQGMVFNSLSYVVRAIAAILGSAALFAIFGTILGTHDYVGQIIVVTILSVLVCYFVEFIYKKKAKVFYSLKYGVLVALIVFGTIRMGTNAIDHYIPTNYDYFVINMNDYYAHQYTEMTIKEESLIEAIDDLNRELLDYYKYNEKDIRNNQLFGHISIRFYDEQFDNYFSRQYNYTSQMKESILNQEKYRDLLYYIFTENERDLLERISHKKEIIIEIEESKFVIDEEQEFYLFENYLKQGMDDVYASPMPILESLQDIDVYMSGEDSQGNYVSYNSMIIYNALLKTFGF